MAEIWPIIKKIGRQSKWASEVCIHIVSEYSVGIHPNHPFSCLGIHPIHPVLSQKLASRPCVACSQFFYLACLFFSNSSITLIRKLDNDICGGRVSFCCLDCVIAFSFWNKKPSIWRWAKENSQPTDDNCWRTKAILGVREIWALTPLTPPPCHNTLAHKVCLLSREIEEKFSVSNKGIKKFDKLNLYLLSHFTKQEINSELKVFRQALPLQICTDNMLLLLKKHQKRGEI